jgi:NAD(P)-dependent dehydrogenase (short-subunit alcohol dehydrogenase family)
MHCVITGGSGDIGAAIARRFALGGARVTLLGRTEAKLRAVLTELEPFNTGTDSSKETGNREEGGLAHGFQVVDVGREDDVRSVMEHIASADQKTDFRDTDGGGAVVS